MKQQCLVCQTEYKAKFRKRGFDYAQCPQCKLVVTLPLPDSATIEKHYEEQAKKGNYALGYKMRDAYQPIHNGLKDHLKNELKLLGKNIKGLKVLDIGCFLGGFIEALHKEGADVLGIELQTEAVEFVNKILPGKVLNSDVYFNNLPSQSFDVISINGVIEHVLNPDKLVARIHELLAPGGIIMIQTPDSGSWLARTMSKHWFPYTPVEHIFLFSEKSLKLLFKQKGFEFRRRISHKKNLPIEFVYRVLGTFGPEFQKLLSPLYKASPQRLKDLSIPFYIGEMIVFGQKNSLSTEHQDHQ
ncbi:MAG: class I SAM-dependent methyltransferase [Bdellovibrionales bacterium]